MRRIWVFAVIVVAILVVALVWIRSAGQQKVPEPSAADAFVANTAVPAKKFARQKHEGCTPLVEGGFSCGACREDTDCPKK